jgi:hypothetical protein
MRLHLLFSLACLLLFCLTATAQIPTRPDMSGGGSSINPRAIPANTPAISDPTLQRIGTVEFWAPLAPRKNLAPSVTRIFGKDLHVALFNDTGKAGKLESSIAFQLRPFVDNQMIKVEVFAVEQNGRTVARTALTKAQSIALKKQGAVLPFTVDMQEGESLVCEVIFSVAEKEHGKAKIKVSKKGLDFVAEEK